VSEILTIAAIQLPAAPPNFLNFSASRNFQAFTLRATTLLLHAQVQRPGHNENDGSTNRELPAGAGTCIAETVGD